MAGGRPCQLSHNDWSIPSYCFGPWGPSPALVFIALLLHNTPKFGHHSSSSVRGDAWLCRVICHREVPKPQIQGPRGHSLSHSQFGLLLQTLNIRVLSVLCITEWRWRSNKRSAKLPLSLCLYEPLICGDASFKHCAAARTIQGSVLSSAITKQQGYWRNSLRSEKHTSSAFNADTQKNKLIGQTRNT